MFERTAHGRNEGQRLIRSEDQTLKITRNRTVDQPNLSFDVILAGRCVPINEYSCRIGCVFGPFMSGIP
jgi:hypothetical protein